MSVAMAEGNATVLLVDDDELLLKLGRIQLEDAGFYVITGRNGEEAVD